MISTTTLVILLGVVAIFGSQVNCAPSVMPTVCTVRQVNALPCMCCRKSCWYGMSEMTSGYFGNMPGERNDAEARFTIALMHECVKLECSEACSHR
ncbi:hypothetical protein CAEBREN_13862 [Caenorhabditis brenneri]|uniref:Uncharacterized protein n=1 Tax=Caenorhabditis brenneri TaxID=135651 RepID=G0N480_CAEBE|nr:hypothetical protein CAEBREN_13862 [Caenorhabditis brenneri]